MNDKIANAMRLAAILRAQGQLERSEDWIAYALALARKEPRQ